MAEARQGSTADLRTNYVADFPSFKVVVPYFIIPAMVCGLLDPIRGVLCEPDTTVVLGEH